MRPTFANFVVTSICPVLGETWHYSSRKDRHDKTLRDYLVEFDKPDMVASIDEQS